MNCDAPGCSRPAAHLVRVREPQLLSPVRVCDEHFEELLAPVFEARSGP